MSVNDFLAQEVRSRAEAMQAAEFVRTCDLVWLSRFPERIRVVDKCTFGKRIETGAGTYGTFRSDGTVWDGRFVRRRIQLLGGVGAPDLKTKRPNVSEYVLAYDGFRWLQVARVKNGMIDWRAIRSDENPDDSLEFWLYMSCRNAFGYETVAGLLSETCAINVQRGERNTIVIDLAVDTEIAEQILGGGHIAGLVGWRLVSDGQRQWRPTRLDWIYASARALGRESDAGVRPAVFGGRQCVVGRSEEWMDWSWIGGVIVPQKKVSRTVAHDDIFETVVEGVIIPELAKPDWFVMSLPIPRDYGALGEIKDLGRSGSSIVDMRSMSDRLEQRRDMCERSIAAVAETCPTDSSLELEQSSGGVALRVVLGALLGSLLVVVFRKRFLQ